MAEQRKKRLSVACESDTPKRNERDRRKILSTLVNEPLRFDGEDIENSQEKENTGLESPVEVNSDSKKYLDALDSYVNTILESEEKDQLLDLKYFDKEKLNVTLSELEEAKHKAEKIAKIAEDHTGISDVHVEKAIEGGVLAFANSNVVTRNRLKDLKRRSDHQILFEKLPETGSLRKSITQMKLDRDNQIAETFVDFKTELKAKYDVLKRVEELGKFDHLSPKTRFRNRRSVPAAPVKNVPFKTPKNKSSRILTKMLPELINDNFIDFKAQEFVQDNQTALRVQKLLRKAVAHNQTF